mmetsp:Transcript_60290/g.111825  ORF Transcript_60290/g.111825 Transcript_60290/m.111825 type:complete len:172 (-) Transcript_60290:159-674(-)
MGGQAPSRCCCVSSGEFPGDTDMKRLPEDKAISPMADAVREELVRAHLSRDSGGQNEDGNKPQAAKAPRQYHAVLSRDDPNLRLGLEIVIELVETETEERASVEVTGIVPDSVVSRYNATLEGESLENRISPGHILLAVNGKEVKKMSSREITKEFQTDFVTVRMLDPGPR